MKSIMGKSLLMAALLAGLVLESEAPEAAAFRPVSAVPHAGDWSYSGDTGPSHWGELAPGYAACSKGSEQSPVNLDLTAAGAAAPRGKPLIQYKPTAFTVAHTGYTIQANAESRDNWLILDRDPYRLVQFHFHAPGEHELNGRPYAMELHLVHKNGRGRLAVVGVLIEEGQAQEALAELWSLLPREITKRDIPLTHPIDLNKLLPRDRTSLRYDGSLTTPPCTEGVQWIVFKEPIRMSKEQILAFQSIFGDNHRPVQPLNGRRISQQ